MSPQVLSGVIGVTTHPRVFSRSSALAEVIGFCELLIARAHCAVIHAGLQHWSLFACLCKDADTRGNPIPDAWFAALAVESRRRLGDYGQGLCLFPRT